MATRPDSLFKYCTDAAALQILDSGTLRWSSPVLYRDPLELDYNSRIGFDRDILLQSMIKLASAMIFAADPPQGDTPLINAIKRWREEGRFGNPGEAENVLKELLSKMVDQRMDAIAKIVDNWRDFNRHIRVSCFCNRPDNATAWDRYGESHRGICFRFDTHPQASISNPRPVIYQEQRPQLTELRENIDTILFNLPQKFPPDFEQLLSIKPLFRKQEQEWRSFRRADAEVSEDDMRKWSELIAFNPEELSAVCFGIATPEKVKKAVQLLVDKKYPAARLYQATLTDGRYELEIQKV